ncbi:MAG TPA: hypothetical protein VIE88_17975 [Vicinamibacteria bacterium]|jgi:hypothetical protein
MVADETLSALRVIVGEEREQADRDDGERRNDDDDSSGPAHSEAV